MKKTQHTNRHSATVLRAFFCALATSLFWLFSASAFAQITIQGIEPTALFSKPATNQSLRQRALLRVDNPGTPLAVKVPTGGPRPVRLELTLPGYLPMATEPAPESTA